MIANYRFFGLWYGMSLALWGIFDYFGKGLIAPGFVTLAAIVLGVISSFVWCRIFP